MDASTLAAAQKMAGQQQGGGMNSQQVEQLKQQQQKNQQMEEQKKQMLQQCLAPEAREVSCTSWFLSFSLKHDSILFLAHLLFFHGGGLVPATPRRIPNHRRSQSVWQPFVLSNLTKLPVLK